MKLARFASVSLFTVLCAALPASAGVLIVGGAQQTHATVVSAVAAAVDGDVILVRVSFTNGFTISGKSISVIADTGAPLTVSGIRVDHLSAGQTVVLSGFWERPGPENALTFSANQGSIRVQDCLIDPGWGALGGVVINSCADVAFVNSTINGAPGAFTTTGGTFASPAVDTYLSSVAFYDCTLTGGAGRPGGYFLGAVVPSNATDGHHAVWADLSTLFFSGSTLTGGAGGIGYSGGVPAPTCTTPNNHPTQGGYGGDGLRVDTSGFARLRATTLSAGAAGAGGFDPCGNQVASGGPGASYSGPAASLVPVSGSARRSLAPALVRESTSTTLSFVGEVGDHVYLLSKLAPAHQWWPSIGGTLLVAAPYRRLSMGVVPASGQLDVTLPISALPVGVTEKQLFLQCVMSDTAGTSHAGTSRVLTVLSQIY